MSDDAFQLARRVADALTGIPVPFAVGGALAYGYWGAFRTTEDVDINVFAGPEAVERVVAALAAIGGRIDLDHTRRRVAEGAHGIAWFGDVRVDLFFDSIPLHAAAAARTVEKPLLQRPAPVLSAEDTVLFKLLFFRAKDVVDIARVLGVQGPRLDRDYVRRWLVDMVGEDDRRTLKWDELCRELPAA